MSRLVTALALCATAGAALAEESTLLAKSGAWELYKGEYAFMEEDGWAVISPSCYAWTGNDNANMSFAALPEQVVARNPDLKGIIYLQIGAQAFDFRKHVANLTVGDGQFNITIEGAFYDEAFVMVNMGGNGETPPEFKVATEIWRDRVTVADENRRPLAKFPVSGLKSIYAQLLQCAGLQ
jgi:hypothetical protein